jgi:hypothetical protein
MYDSPLFFVFPRANRGAGCLSRIDANIAMSRCSLFRRTPSPSNASPATTTLAPRDYDFDPDDLLKMEPHVRHDNLDSATNPDHPW